MHKYKSRITKGKEIKVGIDALTLRNKQKVTKTQVNRINRII